MSYIHQIHLLFGRTSVAEQGSYFALEVWSFFPSGYYLSLILFSNGAAIDSLNSSVDWE